MQTVRTTKAMYKKATPINTSDALPGDLVFFHTTGDGAVSHVGLYIGNGQFISAVSDGPNTGVILSSLNENYWKTRYIGAGTLLGLASEGNATGEPADEPPKISLADSGTFSSPTEPSANDTTTPQPDNTQEANKALAAYIAGASAASLSPKKEPLINKFYLDAIMSVDWQLFTATDFIINWRGITAKVAVVYKDTFLKAGVGTGLRYNYGSNAIQIPLEAQLFLGDCFKMYMGPVFTMGTGGHGIKHTRVIGASGKTEPCIFPGTFGLAIMTPPAKTKSGVTVQFMQDFNYTFYKNCDGSPLVSWKAASVGIVFSTGVVVNIPFTKMQRNIHKA